MTGNVLHVPWKASSHNLVRYRSNYGRAYRNEDTGEVFLSVTTFLSLTADKEWLERWRLRVGPEAAKIASERASYRGTELHRVIECFLRGESTYTKHPEAKYLFGTLRPALESRLTAVHGIELRLCSRVLGVAGTVDCLAVWDGILSIVDWKTSTQAKSRTDIEEYWMQTALYAFMVFEEFGQLPEQLVIPLFSTYGDSKVFTARLQEHVKSIGLRIDAGRAILAATPIVLDGIETDND